MEKIQELNDGNAYIKNVYFGFENMIPTKSKNNKNNVENKSKKKKKSKSKEKKQTKKNTKIVERNDINLKPSQKILEKDLQNLTNKKKSKKNSKQKNQKTIKKEEAIEVDRDNNLNNTVKDNTEKRIKSKSKKKKKSKSKSKKKKNKSNSIKKDVKIQGIQTKIKNFNDDILDYIEMEPPQYNEIKDYAMNEVSKHIHDLSLTFIKLSVKKKENNFSRTILKNKNEMKKKNKNNKKTDSININNNLIIANETILKRPYTAHGYKIRSKSKTKKLSKTIKSKHEEEKIMAFKEKVYVHDKILSLFNNFNLKEDTEEKTKLNKTVKPRVKSALAKDNPKHYLIPKQKDILKQKNLKKKEIEYYEDKYEDDSAEIKKDQNAENETRNKNDKAFYLIKSSNKLYGKSQQSISEIKHMLNRDNKRLFLNNFLIKHNFDTKKEEIKVNYNIPDIKYYYGGKKLYRPKPSYTNKSKMNNTDTDILKHSNDKRYKLFNPKDIIVNPNNKFNFFHQTFTKEPKYGKFFESPDIEKNINNDLAMVPFHKWNPRFKIKKFINEEKENKNDVYNYDYKYDDLNYDSDNELPNTDFKAKNMPEFKKVKYDYKNYKTGKLVKIKKDDKLSNNGDYMDKKIFHPFLINDDIVNI